MRRPDNQRDLDRLHFHQPFTGSTSNVQASSEEAMTYRQKNPNQSALG
jgi:hypothetical protein